MDSIFRIFLGVVGSIFGLCVFVGLMASLPSDKKKGSVPAEDNVIARTAAATPPPVEYVTESCKQLSKLFGISSDLTDLQKKALWKQYKGKNFRWSMKVESVDEELIGSGYTGHFKCRGSRAFSSDVILDIEHGNVAMRLKKNHYYKVEGRLKYMGNFVGLTAVFVGTYE